MVTVGSLAYSIVANTQQFTAGIVASKSELRTLKEAFVSTQSPTERFSASIDHLTQLAQKFPAKADVINRSIQQMRAEMSKAEFDASRFGQVWNKIGFNIDPVSVASRAFGVARDGVNAVVEKIEDLNQLSKRSELLGVPVRSMIGLSEAAEKLSGVDLPQFESAFTKMASNIAAAAMGEGEAGGALARLGLDPEKLSGLRADDQFLAIADALQNVQNAGERLALSKTILGKGGVELASTLAAGGDAIRRIADEEIRASQIDLVNLDDIKSAHEAMDDLSDSVKGLSNAFASELAPSIVQATNALTTLINTGGKPAARGVMAGLSSFIVGAAGNAFSGGSAAAAAAARFMPGQQAELGNGGAIDQERITAARDAAELKAADARYKADSKRQEELADLEEKATKAEAERLKKNKEIAEEFDKMAEGVAKEIRDSGEKIREGLRTPAERLRDEAMEAGNAFRLGSIDAATRDRALLDFKARAADMAGSDAAARTIGVVRGGSVEALRQQFGGNVTEKQLAEQKKTAENTTQANTLLGEIKTVIANIQLREAL